MQRKSRILTTIYSCLGLMLLFLSQITYAITIGPNTLINTPITYSNTTLDLSNGNFVIRDGGILTIENSIITGTISPTNPMLVSVEKGKLILTKNQVNITASSITPQPHNDASYFAIRLNRGTATLNGNSFHVDQQFSVGLFSTLVNIASTNINISNNTIENFHGAIYLLNSSHAIVDNNILKSNSNGNILIIGSNGYIGNNSIYFSGLNQLGDAIDVLASDTMLITKNVIFTPTSEGIFIVRSDNVVVDMNTITGGITYGARVQYDASIPSVGSTYLTRMMAQVGKHVKMPSLTKNVTISNNYFGQNRYGLGASDVDNLTVSGNYFTQRFDNAAARQFWTDNSNLLTNINTLNWVNNYYKEAFTQVNGGDNSMTTFVVFPVTGGVVL